MLGAILQQRLYSMLGVAENLLLRLSTPAIFSDTGHWFPLNLVINS